MQKKNLAFFVFGAAILTGSAVVAYIKREAIKDATNDIVDKVKKLLKKEQENIVD